MKSRNMWAMPMESSLPCRVVEREVESSAKAMDDEAEELEAQDSRR